MSLKIAYIMSRFPGLSETFILREMDGMASLGWSLALFPLIVQRESVEHDEVKPWLGKTRRMTWLDAVTTNTTVFLDQPMRYLSILMHVVRGNLSNPGFLARALVLFPKAVWMGRQMELEGISHIHAHYATHPALAAWVIHQFTGISYSITVHAHDIFIHQTMLAVKLKSALFVAAISNFNRQFLMDRLGEWIGQKTFVVHCGIEPRQYSPHIPGDNGKRQFEILSIGTLRDYKGQKYLIEACAILRRNNIPFHLRIIGGGVLHNTLLNQIGELNLTGHVELAGPKTQAEVSRLLSSVDCYVQPSIVMPSGRMEGIPVSLMEALACALPVIATSISGIHELVCHEETGWLVPEKSAEALAAAMIQIYNDPTRALRVGMSGRTRVLREFDLRENVQRLSGLFHKYISQEAVYDLI